jgi:uncharacterized protein (TIGR03083 family)
VSGVDKSRYLTCLESDYRRLRAVAEGKLDAQVPSCPEWTMADLVVHVAQVYTEKADTIITGEEQTWPPETPGDGPIAMLEHAYVKLLAELTARASADPAPTWYKPEQNVGFWVRRMAQESVIHRVDGELAAGVALADIPDDLAVDGADEVLVRFLSYGSFEYPEYFDRLVRAAGPDGRDGRAVRVDAGDYSWSVRLATTGIAVSTQPDDTAARVSGAPVDILLWLWRRVDDTAVKIDGDADLVATLRRLLGVATQ